MSMLNEKRAAELLDFTSKMIQAPSYSGQENLVVDVMKKFCEDHKFTDVHVDRYGNCICHIKGSKPGPKILFDGHEGRSVRYAGSCLLLCRGCKL